MNTERGISLKDANMPCCESCVHKGLCKFESDYDDIFNKIKEDIKELALLYKDMGKSPIPFSPTVFCRSYQQNHNSVTRSFE